MKVFPVSCTRWFARKRKIPGQHCVHKSRATDHCCVLPQLSRYFSSNSRGISPWKECVMNIVLKPPSNSALDIWHRICEQIPPCNGRNIFKTITWTKT
jgi:hypothetical protein